MTTNENPAAVRVCAIADIQCSRGCGTGECKREREARYPDLQPAAAPIDDARECLMDVVSHHDNIVAGFAAQRLAAQEAQDSDSAAYWKHEIDVAHRMKAQAERALAATVQPAPSPADERAALRECVRVLESCRLLCNWPDMQIAIDNAIRIGRAASANETEAERADEPYLVMLDVRDLFAYLRAAWREGQHYDREDMPDQADSWSAASDYANKTIERWTSMRPVTVRSPAMAAEAPEGLPHWFEMFLTNVCELPDRNSPDGEPDAIVATLDELRNCALNAIEQCISYAAPQPAQASYDDHRDAIDYAIQVLQQVEAADGTFVGQCADAISGLESLLAAHPGQPEPRAEVAGDTRERRHWNPVYNTDPVQRACAELPDGWEIQACMENGAGWVDVYDPTGEKLDFDSAADHFDWRIHEAIDFAIDAARTGASS